jgi:hypothetical protein
VLAREQDGQAELINKTRISVESAELQLGLLDGIVHGQFRPSSKDDWQTVGECPLLEAAAPQIGLFTHGGPGDVKREVELRSFALLVNQ